MTDNSNRLSQGLLDNLDQLDDDQLNELFDSSAVVREYSVFPIISFFLIFFLALTNFVLYSVNQQLFG